MHAKRKKRKKGNTMKRFLLKKKKLFSSFFPILFYSLFSYYYYYCCGLEFCHGDGGVGVTKKRAYYTQHAKNFFFFLRQSRVFSPGIVRISICRFYRSALSLYFSPLPLPSLPRAFLKEKFWRGIRDEIANN